MTEGVRRYARASRGDEPVALVPDYVEADGPLGVVARQHQGGRSMRSLGGMTPELEQAAWLHLRRIQPLFARSTEDHMLAWLIALAPHTINPPESPMDISARAGAVWQQCRDLPCGVWCEATLLAWGRTPDRGRFWPMAGEVHGLLSAFARRMGLDHMACEAALAEAGRVVSVDDASPPSPEAVAAVREIVASWRRERRPGQPRPSDHNAAVMTLSEPPPRPVPKLLTPIEMIRTLEPLAAAGNQAAATRLGSLRERLTPDERARLERRSDRDEGERW